MDSFDPIDGGNHIDLGPEAGLPVMACVNVCIHLPPDFLSRWEATCIIGYSTH